MRIQQSVNCADARLDTPETEPELLQRVLDIKEEDIMAKDSEKTQIDTRKLFQLLLAFSGSSAGGANLSRRCPRHGPGRGDAISQV